MALSISDSIRQKIELCLIDKPDLQLKHSESNLAVKKPAYPEIFIPPYGSIENIAYAKALSTQSDDRKGGLKFYLNNRLSVLEDR